MIITQPQSNFEEIIKGERSAVETYKQVLASANGSSKLDPIRSMSADHIQAVQYFADIAHAKGLKVPDSSGLWGAWAKLTTGLAKSFGDKSSLKILKEGEEHGKKVYESLLEADTVDEQVKSAIRIKFLPQQERHIQELDRLISNV